MKRRNKWTALALIMVMLTGIFLSGCSSKVDPTEGAKPTDAPAKTTEASQKETEAPTEAGVDISEHVELVCYFVSDPPADVQKVQDKINEILEEKINASISLQFTTWTDYKNKYTMILSGAENCDIIFTAPWLMYYSMVEKDAFRDLNGLIDEYAPELREALEPSFFEETLLDGALYTLPNNYKEYSTSGIIYREDLRKKYDLPVPDSVQNIEAFMAGIKKNEPDMQVVNPLCANYFTFIDTEYSLNTVGLRVPYNTITQVEKYWGSDKHVAAMKKLRGWAEEGYWSSDAIAESTTDPLPGFKAGETAIIHYGMNYNKYLSAITTMADPSWEIGYVSSADVNGVAYPAAPYHNGIAIPTISENPERAMMAISLLYTDEELNHLIMYGIEGDHYNVDENGYYVEADNNAAFGYECMSSWHFRNTAVMLHRESENAALEHFDYLDTIAAKTPTPFVNHKEGYGGVITETKNEKAAVDALVTEYLKPLEYGMVADVEGTIEKFMTEANKAGLEKIQSEVTGLWNDYLDSKGY